MPGLPNSGSRWIPDAKIRDYCLSPASEKSRSRLKFFSAHGFGPEDWRRLRDALMAHAETAAVRLVREDAWGRTYRASGRLETPDRRNPSVHAYWIVRPDDPRPQFTSAVPDEERGGDEAGR